MLRLAGAGESHVGLVRTNNQDSGFVGPTCILVADGVGGGAAGEIASATTGYALAQTVLLRPGQDPSAVLAQGVRRAQAQLAAGVEADPMRSGMATTLTAVATDGSRFVLVHLGDSRGYVFRDGELTQVTRDHTYVQDMVEEGRLTTAEAELHPWRNVVLRTVNGSGEGEPDLLELHLTPGDRVLLGSDGLTDLVGVTEMTEVLGRCDDTDSVAHLIAAALARGGKDNITCVVATVVDGPEIAPDGRLLGAMLDPENVVDIVGVRVSGPTRERVPHSSRGGGEWTHG